MDTEDEIRTQRRKEAENKKIYPKAVEIARRLGKTNPKNHGAYHDYDDETLHISWDDYGPNLEILWGNRTVYYYQINEPRVYRPDIGDWEKRLDEIYGKIEPILRREADAAKEKRKDEFFDNWGIRPG